jgi:precorrin-6A synthase
MTRTLLVIGIGTGNPEHMTMQAVGALNRAAVVLIPRKGDAKDDLAELRREICARFLTNPATRLIEFDLPVRDGGEPSYRKGVDAWHDAIADVYAELLTEHTGDGDGAAILVWGDPSLYDSTLRIIERLRSGLDLTIDVIPGVTSVQALAASHKMPLNTIGGPVLITTGRRLREGIPEDVDTIVVMLDGDCAFRQLDPGRFDIYWGAYLGTADEIVLAGPLADLSAVIVSSREAARRRKGWIMDTYLLRRRAD